MAAAIELLDRGTYALDPYIPRSPASQLESHSTWLENGSPIGPRVTHVFTTIMTWETASSMTMGIIC